MTEEEYNNFVKRYDKFNNNNLPTPFWDEERQVLEYVHFYKNKGTKELDVSSTLEYSLGDITNASLYYPFNAKKIITYLEKNKRIFNVEVGHSHEHCFEDVVKALYYSPESFSISKEDEEFYSKQQLEYLGRVQKYLLFIGLKDIESQKIPVSRFRNKKQSKYDGAYVHEYSDKLINDIKNNNRDFVIYDWYPEYSENKKYKPHEYRALIVNENDDFKLFIEYTKTEIKTYKDIKDIIKDTKYKDDDKIILKYFKVLEIFE